MKGLKVLLVGGLVLSMASAALAYTGSYVPGIGINSTPHDLGNLQQVANGMNYPAVDPDGLERICVWCHAPHNAYRLSTAAGGVGPQAAAAFDYLPLWNHTLQTNIAYTMYENGSGAPQVGPRASQAIILGMTPGSTSLLCLSCHDGSVAVNSYGNVDQLARSQEVGTDVMSTSYRIGSGQYLGNHHPIGFSYTAAQAADDELRDASLTNLTATTLIEDHLYGSNGNMECGTCHSVHNTGNGGETLLWRSDFRSELCLTCHSKGIYTLP